MKIHRGFVSIVAGMALAGAWPVGAQVLGGGLGGSAGGGAGGMLGGPGGALGGGFAGAGNAAGQGNAGIDGAGTFGSIRDRTQQTTGVAGRARGHTQQAAEGGKSRLESTRSAVSADAQARKGAAQDTVQQARPDSSANSGDLSLGGGASAEKHAFGRKAAAGGSGESATHVDDSGVLNSSGGRADVSVQKQQPVQPAAPESDAG